MMHFNPMKTFGLVLLFAAITTGVASAEDHVEGSIIFDGFLEDWAEGVQAVSDDRWLYFRHDAKAPTSLQNGSVMTFLQIDLDGNKRTGFPSEDGDLGIDLEIVMTTLDQRDPTKLGGGIEINAYGADGTHESLTHTKVGFSFLPTHASTSFEIRVARDLDGPRWIENMARSAEQIRYRTILRDALYETKFAGEVRSFTLAKMTPGRELFEIAIPGKSADTLRVVSWNVLWGAPSKNPDGFARVLRALNPDAILFQEWDNGYWTNDDRIPEKDYIDWLNTHLGGGAWSIQNGAERGALIASRSRLSAFLPKQITVKANRGAGIRRDRKVRCASARIETPLGELGAVSIHLKSRGGLDSAEDKIRLAETGAVHEAIRGAMSQKKPDFLVIAGDWNLVGGRQPLSLVAGRLDFDGTDLLVLEPRRLGAGDAITWRDQRSNFAPGRLDYALIADDGVEIVHSFVLDTTLFSDASLRRAGLKRKDTDGSDHLPLVIDLRRTSRD